MFLRRLLFDLFRMWGTRVAILQIKRRGMLAYLRMLQVVRRSVVATIAVICVLQLMVIGAVGVFVTGVLLTNQDPAAKLWILLAGFLFILAIPLIGLAIVLSERFWFKLSGAEKFFDEDKAKAPPSPPYGVPIGDGAE